MLNQVVLIGRIVNDLEIKSVNEKNVLNFSIAVARSYKNTDGEYETDFIDCTLWNGVAKNTTKYCKKGDIIGIKGHLQTKKESKFNIIEVIAEKITFLSSKREN